MDSIAIAAGPDPAEPGDGIQDVPCIGLPLLAHRSMASART